MSNHYNYDAFLDGFEGEEYLKELDRQNKKRQETSSHTNNNTNDLGEALMEGLREGGAALMKTLKSDDLKKALKNTGITVGATLGGLGLLGTLPSPILAAKLPDFADKETQDALKATSKLYFFSPGNAAKKYLK